MSVDAIKMASANARTDSAEVDTAVIEDYLIAKLHECNMLQDDDERSKRIRMKVLQIVPLKTNQNSTVAVQNSKPATGVIEGDMDFDMITQRIWTSVLTDKGKQLLEQLRNGLSQHDREDLQELLVWTIYAKMKPDMEELEAAIALRCNKACASSVRQKIEGPFEKAFHIFGSQIYPTDAIEAAIRLPNDRSLIGLPTEAFEVTSSTPVMDDNLYDHLLSYIYTDKMDKSVIGKTQTTKTSSTNKFSFNQHFAEFTILSRLFKALDDDSICRQAHALVTYIADCLPYHLQNFANLIDYASTDELRVVGKGLVSFLRDFKKIEAAFIANQFTPTVWLCDDAIRAIRTILIDDSFQKQLGYSERQWAREKTGEESGEASFLANIVSTAARCWLTDDAHRTNSRRCFLFVDAYLDTVSLDPTLNAKPRSDPTQVDHPRPQAFENKISAPTGVQESMQNVTPTFDVKLHIEPEPEAETTRIQRIKRAERWALETIKIELNSCALERIGFALLGFNEMETAIEYFERAVPISTSPYSAIGLARAYEFKAEDSEPAEAREQYGRAVESIQNALEIFRAQSQIDSENEYSEHDDREVHDLFTCLLRAAGYHESRGEHVAAIDLVAEALKCRPHSADCRWRLIELLCRDGHHAQAQSAFEDWISISSTLGNESPSKFFDRWLTTYAELHRGFLPTMLTMRNTKLDDSIRKAIEKAIKDAKELKQEENVVWLQYALGLIYAANRGVENLAIAERYWLDALHAGREIHLADDTPIQWSSNLISMLCFEQARRKFVDSPELTSEASIALLDTLSNKISQILPLNYKDLSETQRPTAYVAALGNLVSELEYSKNFLTQDMTTAIQILLDDDNADYVLGIQTLFGVLLCYGDYEGAFSAWSLFDRAETRLRGIERRENKLQDTVVRDISRETLTKLETAADQGETTAFLESQRLFDHEGQNDGNERQYTFLMAICDNCSEYIYSRGEDSEIWWCKYCPFIKFCTLCKVERSEGKFVNYRCDPKHPLLLAKHYEYSEEELRADNVRIGWEFATVEAGSGGDVVHRRATKEERVGGRIVRLKEWLEILRQEWGIPKTNTDDTS